MESQYKKHLAVLLKDLTLYRPVIDILENLS